MAIKISYTSREFSSILENIKNQFKDELPEYNDFLDSNIGRWWIETPAAIADMIAFNTDRAAAECYIDSVETRDNLVGLLKLIGFQPSNPVPESTTVTITASEAVNSAVTIPKYTRLLDSVSGKAWVTTKECSISAGSTTASYVDDFASDFANPPASVTEEKTEVPVVQGTWKSFEFISNGLPFQRFLLNFADIADGYVRVFVDPSGSNVEWIKSVNNSLVGAPSTSTVFRYINTRDLFVIIEFGDDVEGAIPTRGNRIKIDYLVTSHINGRAGAGNINTVVGDNNGNTFPVTLNVTNSSSSSGSSDYESINSARLRYPQAFKAINRAVTLNDWSNLSYLVPGVLQANAADWRSIDKDGNCTIPVFSTYVYVITNGGGVDEGINSQVYNYLTPRKMTGITHRVFPASQVLVDVSVHAYVRKDFFQAGGTITSAKSQIKEVITDFFTLKNPYVSDVILGQDVSYAALFSRIFEVRGVTALSLKWRYDTDIGFISPTELPTGVTSADIPMDYSQYPVLSSMVGPGGFENDITVDPVS